MALIITNNISSLQAQNALSQNSASLSKTLEQLSTGLRINTGADGPAAFVISQQQQAQIAGLQQAISNSSVATTLVQTGGGALNEISSLLTQARGLALNSANTGVNDQNALDANQAQLNNILSTINNIANTTQFGQKQLLDGNAGVNILSAPLGYGISVGGATASGTYALSGFTAATQANSLAGTAFATAGGVTGATVGSVTINGVLINLNSSNANTLTNTISTINAVSAQTGVTAVANGTGAAAKLQLVSNTFGAPGNFTAVFDSGATAQLLGYGGGALTTITTATATNGTAATNVAGTLTGPDGNPVAGVGVGNVLSFTTGNEAGLSVTFGALSTGLPGTVGNNGDNFTIDNNSLVFQIGANAGQTASISFTNAETTALGKGATGLTNAAFTSLSTIKINTTQSDAQDALRVIDKAISDVADESGALGAFQTNTLQANSANLSTALTNTTQAESTITDTDFAAATSNLARFQVLTQAGAAVLSSSNQTTQLVLSLLQKIG
jgi:flagellin